MISLIVYVIVLDQDKQDHEQHLDNGRKRIRKRK